MFSNRKNNMKNKNCLLHLINRNNFFTKQQKLYRDIVNYDLIRKEEMFFFEVNMDTDIENIDDALNIKHIWEK